ncbi:MAG: hypothetical protein CMJ89_13310 [Planctomycetes bacterium]|nr:hypothetical protein [Planctomycetota bacterium]
MAVNGSDRRARLPIHGFDAYTGPDRMSEQKKVNSDAPVPERHPGRAILLAAVTWISTGCGSSHEAALSQDKTASSSMPHMQVRTQPRVLGPHAPRVGKWVADLRFRDVDGKALKLSDVAGRNGLILAMRDPDCPLSKRYTPRIKRLESEAAAQGFGLLLVNPYDRESALRDIDLYALDLPYAVDENEEIARALSVNTTTEFFVIDAAQTLAYRGMIDDQYGLAFAKQKASNTYLLDALADLSSGRNVAVPATEAQGCLLSIGDGPSMPAKVTYQKHVSRIIQKRCQRCHRPGTAAPFSLMSYGDARRRAPMIRLALEEGFMPPWFSVGETGPWSNDARLTTEEKRDLLSWIANGMPEGDPSHAPLPVNYPDGWAIEPDLIVEFPSNDVPAEGVLDYLYQYATADLREERWIKAVEILPGAPQVVHHILFWNESPEYYEGWKKRDPAVVGKFELIERYFAMMVPGQEATRFPKGYGRLLPAQAPLKVQFHYTPDGRAVTDQTRIGFEFSEKPPQRFVESNVSAQFKFAIPPHAENYEISGDFTFPINGTLLSLLPHGHLRAKSFRVDLVLPDGTEELLLDVPQYDFNWQMNYVFEQPREVPKGAVLRATGWYDNSADNPANPDPEQTVRFGRQTTQEMMVIFFQWSPRM